MNRGILYGTTAYVVWGLSPIYWKHLQGVSSLEIIANRVLWSFVLVLIVLLFRKQWGWLHRLRYDPKMLLTLGAAALLLGLNWLTYVWAVNSGFVVEASLGYFITPLVSVALGVIILRERLRPWQWVAIALAACGVLYLTIAYGSLPWISLILAFSFGLYGYMKKRGRLPVLESLGVETGWLLIPTLIVLIVMQGQNTAALGHADALSNILLIGSGVMTAVPLLMFATGARMIPLTVLGILQFIAPTLQFLLGVFVYDEPFNIIRLVGFSIIWVALIIYVAENFAHRRTRHAVLAPVSAGAGRGSD
ncbi:MAG: EamA family transporter RarD [Caldilineales bacterium]|nr:EamA family transporter RarD [Caldilineales bacterium]